MFFLRLFYLFSYFFSIFLFFCLFFFLVVRDRKWDAAEGSVLRRIRYGNGAGAVATSPHSSPPPLPPLHHHHPPSSSSSSSSSFFSSRRNWPRCRFNGYVTEFYLVFFCPSFKKFTKKPTSTERPSIDWSREREREMAALCLGATLRNDGSE